MRNPWSPSHIATAATLIPPGARGEVGIGLGIAGGLLLIVAGCLGKDEPVRHRGAARQTYVGVDIDAADIDVSGT